MNDSPPDIFAAAERNRIVIETARMRQRDKHKRGERVRLVLAVFSACFVIYVAIIAAVAWWTA